MNEGHSRSDQLPTRALPGDVTTVRAVRREAGRRFEPPCNSAALPAGVRPGYQTPDRHEVVGPTSDRPWAIGSDASPVRPRVRSSNRTRSPRGSRMVPCGTTKIQRAPSAGSGRSARARGAIPTTRIHGPSPREANSTHRLGGAASIGPTPDARAEDHGRSSGPPLLSAYRGARSGGVTMGGPSRGQAPATSRKSGCFLLARLPPGAV